MICAAAVRYHSLSVLSKGLLSRFEEKRGAISTQEPISRGKREVGGGRPGGLQVRMKSPGEDRRVGGSRKGRGTQFMTVDEHDWS
jgi:hypothetical protein